MDVITAIREILLSLYLLGGIVLVLALIFFAFLTYRAAKKGVFDPIRRAGENFERVSEAAVEHIAKPLEEGISAGNVAGNAIGFATGFVAGMRGGSKKAEGDGGGKKRGKRGWIPFL